MFLDDDLDLQRAWKRLYAVVVVLAVLAFVSFVWFGVFTIPKRYPISLISGGLILFLRGSSLYVEVETFGATLFRIINFSEVLARLSVVLLIWIPFIVVGTYNFLIIRLARDGSYWFVPLSTKPSDRYQTYGEAKRRIKQIVISGTREEKSAVYTFVAFQTVGFGTVLMLFLFYDARILPFDLLVVDLLLLAVLGLAIVVQRRMWNTIK